MAPYPASMSDLKSRIEAFERQLIVAALREENGHQRRTARALGILPTTLHEKMKRLGIPTSRMAYPVGTTLGETETRPPDGLSA
jgi:DNA-binding NtrC family response regulator